MRWRYTSEASRCCCVLDNWEQLLPGARIVAELLAAAPLLHVLATSRVPLRLGGEQRYRLAPLGTPSRAGVGTDDRVGHRGAAGLGRGAPVRGARPCRRRSLRHRRRQRRRRCRPVPAPRWPAAGAGAGRRAHGRARPAHRAARARRRSRRAGRDGRRARSSAQPRGRHRLERAPAARGPGGRVRAAQRLRRGLHGGGGAGGRFA